MRKLILWAVAAFLIGGPGPAAHGGDWTVRLELNGRQLEGMPVAWSTQRVYLLARDGHLWDFHPGEAKNFEKVSSGFRSYTQSEIRGQLLREFGRQFDVSGTGHYLVVHPAGQRDCWAGRFEQLYRSCIHYFTARGLRPTEPRFPLVAVVFHRRQDFQRFAAKAGARVGASTLGYYSPRTNRILLYDVTAGRAESTNWYVNAETIIHEATHQTAFNIGIHSRLAACPAWVVEGLASMFEAPGVWNSRQHTRLSDRINRSRLNSFKKYAARNRQGEELAKLICSDKMFGSQASRAYAESWALTFYLVEREPRKYARYLAKTARRPVDKPYSRAHRLKDFTDIFGTNLALLDARQRQFMAGLK